MPDDSDELARFREAWKAEVQQKKATQEQPNANSASPFQNDPSQASTSKIPGIKRQSQLSVSPRLHEGGMDYKEHYTKGNAVTLNATPVDEAAQHQAVRAREGVTGSLVSLLEKFPNNLTFISQVEETRSPIGCLPDELLVLILRKLGPSSIERFASVCRKARVVTLEPVIWKELCEMIYRPPQIPASLDTTAIARQYNFDYRRAFVSHPRVRLDGIYIAVCHYVRQGLSEKAWVNITQLITYHRYLRFLSNGQVLSLLATEEHSPKDIVSRLQPDVRIKGMLIGTWELCGTTVIVRDLLDAVHLPPTSDSDTPPATSSTRSYAPHHDQVHILQPSSPPRYNFQMHLGLRSRPTGRWNKLELLAYESVALDSGEVSQFSLKNEKRFRFSRVKSWGW